MQVLISITSIVFFITLLILFLKEQSKNSEITAKLKDADDVLDIIVKLKNSKGNRVGTYTYPSVQVVYKLLSLGYKIVRVPEENMNNKILVSRGLYEVVEINNDLHFKIAGSDLLDVVQKEDKHPCESKSLELSDIKINAKELLDFLNSRIGFQEAGCGEISFFYKFNMYEITDFITGKFPECTTKKCSLTDQQLQNLREAKSKVEKNSFF